MDIDNAAMNIIKVYIAQMNSAMKISKIICEHEGTDELTGDHVISGLVYRLMNPMTDEDMMQSLEKADKLMNGGDSSDEYEDDEYDLSEEEELNDLVYKAPDVFRKIKTNTCQCDICSRVRECLQGYESYETYDPMVTRFKDSIKETCEKHKIII
jgi:hypothetical protein